MRHTAVTQGRRRTEDVIELLPMALTKGTVAWLLVLLTLAACAPRRPLLYPNERLKQVGADVAERDVDDCIRRAQAFVSTGGRAAEATRTVAAPTAVGGATGAAVGVVGGAVAGSPGEGAAIGAATGATAGFLQGLFSVFQTSEPPPTYANFVDRCLRERGYDPIGWK